MDTNTTQPSSWGSKAGLFLPENVPSNSDFTVVYDEELFALSSWGAVTSKFAIIVFQAKIL